MPPQDAGRQREIYEAEVRALRAKLRDTQQKLSQLEADTQRVKPLFFMKQYEMKSQDKGKGRDMQPPSSNPQQIVPPTSSNEPRHRTSRERAHGASKSSKRRHTPFTSDAYAEHFLLAAKRIGRVRATQVSGLTHYAEQERELLSREQQRVHDVREQERLERERLDRLAAGTSGLAYYRSTAEGVPQRVPAAPHTPKKQIHYGPNSVNTPIVFVHTLSPPTPVPHAIINAPVNNLSATGYVGSPLASSHSVIHGGTTTGRGGQTQKTQMMSNPPTPLDSLLDAARMMDDGADATPRKPNGKGRALEDPDSPVPKRRRISGTRLGNASPVAGGSGSQIGREGNTDTIASQGRGLGKDRVRSALDVLADQADQASAAFNEPEQTGRRPALTAGPATKGKARTRNSTTSEHPRDDGTPPLMSFIQVDPGATSASTTTTASRWRTRTRGGIANKKRAPNNTTTPSSPTSTQQSFTPTTPSNETPKTTQPTTSASGRPQRTAAKRNVALSPGALPPQTRVTSTSSARGTNKPRGRPRGSTNRRGGVGRAPSVSSEPRIISPSNARVIAPAPWLIPSEEPGQRGQVVEQGSVSPQSGLRSSNTPLQSERGPDQTRLRNASQHPSENALEQARAADTVTVDRELLDVQSTAEPGHRGSLTDGGESEPAMASGTVSFRVTLSPLPVLPSDPGAEIQAPGAEGETDADAEAEADIDEDLDAEGEQEDDMESEPKDIPPRSKSPTPPPDPPPPASDSGPPYANDDGGSDGDADAEGEVDFEEGEGSMTGGSRTPGTQPMMQATLTVSDKGFALQTANRTQVARTSYSRTVSGDGTADARHNSYVVKGVWSTRAKPKERIHCEMPLISRKPYPSGSVECGQTHVYFSSVCFAIAPRESCTSFIDINFRKDPR